MKGNEFQITEDSLSVGFVTEPQSVVFNQAASISAIGDLNYISFLILILSFVTGTLILVYNKKKK